MNQTYTFQYDGAGNILSKKEYAYSLQSLLSQPSQTYTYLYQNTQWKDQLTKITTNDSSYNISYDTMGYPTSIANHTLTWNKSGTLNQWDQTTYSYNIKNQLIQKVGNGITTNYYAINHKIHQINIGTNILKFNDGKYTINTLLVDYDEYLQANNIFEKYLPELCKIINQTLSDKSKKILSFPFLSRQDNLNFIFWSLIQKINNHFEDKVNELLKEKYFCDVKPVERVFSTATIAYTNEQNPTFDVWGCDSAFSNAIGGYQSVFVSNIYGKYLDRHFYVGHNLSCDQKILMLLRSIHGITIDSLTEIEKEIVAQCIECGYLQKNDNLVEPKIVIIDKKDAADFNHLAMEFVKDMQPIIEKIAAELSVFLKKHIPAHLMNEYQNYTYLIATAQNYSKLIDACLQENILSKPKNRLGAEGVFMIVEKLNFNFFTFLSKKFV